MKNGLLIFLIFAALVSSGFAQFQVKSQGGTLLMQVTDNGEVGIGIGSTAPSALLDVSGTIRFRSLTKGSLTYPVLTVDADGNLDVVEDRQGSGVDGVVSGANVNGSTTKTLTLSRSHSLSDVTATWTDMVDDADAVIGNEYPQGGEATSVNTRRVNVRVDNSSIKINSNNQLYAMPGLEMYAHSDNPRNILIKFNGNSIEGVYYRDGAPVSMSNPSYPEWTSTTNYSTETWTTHSRVGLGIEIPPSLANILDPTIKAIQVRVGAFPETGDDESLFYAGHTVNSALKQMGDMSGGTALEANGLLFLNEDQKFYLISQYQSDSTRRLTELWVTIFGGLR